MKTYKRILFVLFLLMTSATISAQKTEIVSHTVTQGQTLYSISKIYNTTVDEIIKFNPGSAEKLSIGQKLIIPSNSNNNSKPEAKENRNGKTHTIQKGETLYRLSKMYNVTTDELCAANPGLSINNFRTGEVIIIPTKEQPKKEETVRLDVPQKEEEKLPVIVGTHKVQRKENIDIICEMYNITREDLIKVNPTLKEQKLKRKMVLNIPEPSIKEKPILTDIIQENKEEIEKAIPKGINDDKVLNVAVILSFLLDSYAPKEQSRMVEY